MKKNFSVLFAWLMVVGLSAQETGVLVLKGPKSIELYQATSLSTNGKWACGVISQDDPRGFLWNLTTDEFTSLSSGDNSTAMDVSDNGIVAGTYPNTELSPNGVAVESAGYWKEGKWYSLPLDPDGSVSSSNGGGMAYCISTDGKYIGGAAYINGVFSPIRWTSDGEMTIYEAGTYTSSSGQTAKAQGVIMDISDDGDMAVGWAEHPELHHNRTSVAWINGEASYLNYESDGPFNLAQEISPNGKYILVDNSSIYDVEQKTLTNIISNKGFWSATFYGITDNGTVVGYVQESMNAQPYGTVYKDGTFYNINSYLKERGAQLDQYLLYDVIGISSDEKTFLVMAYDLVSEDDNLPLVIKLDENITTREPVSLKATQMEGLEACKLRWSAPLVNAEAVTGYNIYRDGTRLNAGTVDADAFFYVDETVSMGETYSYTVRAVYASGESADSEASVVEMAERELSAPNGLYALQAGLNSVRLFWNRPSSNLVGLKYFDESDEVQEFGGGTYNFEAAIRIPAEELAYYKDMQITGFTFYPMSRQNSWTVSFYTGEDCELLYSETIDADDLQYGVENNLTLKQAVAIPEGEDLTMGIKVDVTGYGGYDVIGAIDGKMVRGCSDLIRRPDNGETSFYSLYDSAQESENGAYDLYTTWPMSILVDPGNVSDEVSEYRITENGSQIGITQELKYVKKGLADGTYTYGVTAAYADGSVSPAASVEITVAQNMDVYKAVSGVKATVDGTKLTATWQAPVDNDETLITYATGNYSGGLVGSSDNQYSYYVGTTYSGDKLKGYDGYLINGFRFYPLADADFRFILRVDDVQVAEQSVGTNYVTGSWNTVLLDEPVVIEPGSEYFLILDCYDVTPERAPLGYDDQLVVSGVSDLYSVDEGETFTAVSEEMSGVGNWMMGLLIGSEEADELPVNGYNVRIDNEQVNAELLKETVYEHEFSNEEEGTHRLNVDVMYDVVGEKQGDAVFFTISSTGIDENVLPSVYVSSAPTESYVKVEGDVRAVAAYSIAGTLVAQTEGNTLNVSHLVSGVYVLNVTTGDGNVQIKVNIIR